MKGKGTVTPLSSVFSVEDTQKAAQRVHDTIAHNDHELQRLLGFVADNNDLVNLVGRLPDHLHHDIMVPFGKAAFFPGRLVHTNEFTVLLGEGYYAERTCKQTIEILNRRGKVLESQVDSLKAMLQNLKAEASFFNATASEAAEGLVEIMEDYEDESSSDKESAVEQNFPINSAVATSKHVDEDEDFVRMMARMEELEKQEREAESQMSQSNEDSRFQHTLHQLSNLNTLHEKHKTSEQSLSRIPQEETRDRIALNKDGLAAEPICSGLEASSKDKLSHGNILPPGSESVADKGFMSPVFENFPTMSSSKSQVSLGSSKPNFDREKAFTGSIIERADNLNIISSERTSATSQSNSSRGSKPVSRFKMQRK